MDYWFSYILTKRKQSQCKNLHTGIIGICTFVQSVLLTVSPLCIQILELEFNNGKNENFDSTNLYFSTVLGILSNFPGLSIV